MGFVANPKPSGGFRLVWCPPPAAPAAGCIGGFIFSGSHSGSWGAVVIVGGFRGVGGQVSGISFRWCRVRGFVGWGSSCFFVHFLSLFACFFVCFVLSYVHC